MSEIIGYFVVRKDCVNYLPEIALRARKKRMYPYYVGAIKEARRIGGKIIKMEVKRLKEGKGK